MVFDHPHFVVPEADGHFALADVPAGPHRLSAWHERIGESAKSIVVEAGTHGHGSSSRCRWRSSDGARPRPPRFVVRTTVATLVMVAGVLTTVFVGVTLNVRERVNGTVREKLDAGQRMLSALEQRRALELSAQVGMLAENPTLKAAVDTYQADLGSANPTFRREILATIDRELEKLAARIGPDVLAVTDPSGAVLAVAGRRGADWPVEMKVHARSDGGSATWVTLPSGVFQFASSTLDLAGDRDRVAAPRQGPRQPVRARALDALRRGHAHRIGRCRGREHAPRRSGECADAGGAARPSVEGHGRPRLVRVRRQAPVPGW